MSAPSVSPPWFNQTLFTLLERTNLEAVGMCQLMHGLLADGCDEAEAAALLVALRMKGETADELAAAAAVLREHMRPLDLGTDLLDTCGTGGDGTGTFNISTATALVVAGAGVPVVKHGNRAVSGRSGSADVLAALGVDVESPAMSSRSTLESAGMVFCHAPAFHPALRRLALLRRRLGVRTLFNCLGPLANPAGAPYQLLGVGRPEWLDPMSVALARLGTRRALLVCGRDGLDEVSLSAPTLVREVCGNEVRSLEWNPVDFGLEPCSLNELRADSPDASAALVREAVEGPDGPARRVVLANAAAALLAAGRVTSPREGTEAALKSVRSGAGARVLAALSAVGRGVSASNG